MIQNLIRTVTVLENPHTHTHPQPQPQPSHNLLNLSVFIAFQPERCVRSAMCDIHQFIELWRNFHITEMETLNSSNGKSKAHGIWMGSALLYWQSVYTLYSSTIK